MSAERVRLSEYIEYLQGIVKKYGDIPISYSTPADESLILKPAIFGDKFYGEGPYEVKPCMVIPEERRVHWKQKESYLTPEDVGQYVYGMGCD